jgi:hypothetical protein
MSSILPALPGGGSAPPGISDVVSQDDLTRWAQIAGVLKYLTAPLDPPPPPTSPLPISTGVLGNVYSNFAAASLQAGLPQSQSITISAWWAHFLAQIGDIAAFLIQLVALLLTPLAQVVLEGLGDLRKGIDPAVGILAQEVLTEFLGVEVGVQNLPLGIGGADHLARAQAIGALLYNQLEKEFVTGAEVVPSTAPAQTFSGLAVNFGLASGIMGLIGGMVPAAAGHYEELRELGEEVATNIGLGRLVRRALTPLITTLVSNPAQWAINIKYRPTQFKEGELVNPFLGTQLDQATLYNAMHLLGYSDDKIAAFIKMHQKRLAPSQVKLLLDHGQWTENQAEDYMKTVGYPAELQPTALLIEELLEERGPIHELVTELLAEVKAGRTTVDEFTNVLQGLPYSQPTKDIFAAIAAYKAKAMHAARPHQLSGGELFYAFAAGIVTSSDLTDRWTAQGLSQADQDIRLQLWLLHLNRLHELEQQKQTAFQEKVTAFQQKQAGAKKVLSLPVPPVPPFPLG